MAFSLKPTQRLKHVLADGLWVIVVCLADEAQPIRGKDSPLVPLLAELCTSQQKLDTRR